MHRALGLAAGLSILLVTPTGCDKTEPTTANPDAAAAPTDPAPQPDVAAEDDGAGATEDAVDEGAEGSDEGGETSEGGEGEPAEVASQDGDAGDAPAASEGDGPAALPGPKYTKVDDSCGKDPGVGQKLKSFKLKSVDGKTMTNRSWGSKVLLVNFWGTWCKPCLSELPEFARLYRRYRKHGLVLVAIATDEDPEAVKSVLKKSKISAKVAIGGEAYAGKYNSNKFPFTFVVDPKGNIKSSYRGFEPRCMGKLEADIRAELEARNAK
jgi:thiol-disulfide isomerase/thioredoxin